MLQLAAPEHYRDLHLVTATQEALDMPTLGVEVVVADLGPELYLPHVDVDLLFAGGLAGLLFGQTPARTPANVKRILASTSDKVGNGAYSSDPYGTCEGCTWNPTYGYGRINVLNALQGVPVAIPDFTLSIQPSSARLKLKVADGNCP